MKSILIIFLTMFTILGCSSKKLNSYQNNTPKLDLRHFLNGKTKAWGIVEDFNGKITKRFVVEMQTTWNGNKGELVEHFSYDDNTTSKRIWYIEYNENNTFTAKAEDVIGTAKGVQSGNALQINYTLKLPVGNKTYNVKLDDWMYQIDENTLMNKSDIKKFGITVAKLTIFFQKQ